VPAIEAARLELGDELDVVEAVGTRYGEILNPSMAPSRT
jgi:hypothetical protein